MARIPVEKDTDRGTTTTTRNRTTRSAQIWGWIIGLIVLAAIIWILFAVDWGWY